MTGRPTKLTPERQERIVQALRVGNTRTASAGYAGITLATFCNWMNRGEAAKSGLHFEFFDAVKKAEADAEVGMVAVIKKASADTWTAAAWWLERRRFKDYGKKQYTEHAGKDGKPLEVKVKVKPSNDKLADIAQALADLGLIKP